MALLLTLVAVFLILVGSEIWWRRQRLPGEFTRKFVHISVGSFVAFWPYFLSPREIIGLSLAFLAVICISKYAGIFQAIHSVQRPTWGEVWFAIVVGLLAFTIPHHPHIYTAALLVMSLADGLAAVIGTHFGRAGKYTIQGHAKSLIGTATFLVVTAAILYVYRLKTAGALPIAAAIPLVLVATVIENVTANGLDNLLVPLSIAAVLLWVV